MHFISFLCLIKLARTSSTMLIRSDESGHPCVVTDLRIEVFSVLLFSGCRLFIDVLLRLITFPSITSLMIVFIMNEC